MNALAAFASHHGVNVWNVLKMFTPIALPVRQPLLTLAAVAAITGESITDLVPSIEAGYLRLCMNIAAPGTAARCLRISTSSVAEYLQHGRKLRIESPAQARNEIASWFPALSSDLHTASVSRILGCSRMLLDSLTEHGCLRVSKRGTVGRDGSALYSRESVIGFLLARRII